MPHCFNERLNKTYKLSNEYLSLFHNSYLIIIAQGICYIAGAIIAVLLVLSLVNESILLYVVIGEHNLLWYLGIFSAIYATSRSMIPFDNPYLDNEIYRLVIKEKQPQVILQEVASFTHYYPIHWIDREHTNQVMEEFRDLFPTKLQLFLLELLSVILTPLVLCFSLPSSSQKVIEFIK